MPRTARKAPGGLIFHALNRGVGRRWVFDKNEDFAAFERVLGHAPEAHPLERNPLRAKLVERAEGWRWSSLWRRLHPASGSELVLPLADWPMAVPADWVAKVNEPPTQAELAALRQSVTKGRPFGDNRWQAEVTADLGLESTHRPTGRPRKAKVVQ